MHLFVKCRPGECSVPTIVPAGLSVVIFLLVLVFTVSRLIVSTLLITAPLVASLVLPAILRIASKFRPTLVLSCPLGVAATVPTVLRVASRLWSVVCGARTTLIRAARSA